MAIPCRCPVSETHKPAPLSPYGYHKLQCELLCEEFARLFALPTATARIFSAYGPGLRRQVVWDIFERVLTTGALVLHGTGAESRDFIHATDIARALVRLADMAPCQGEVYNVASGEEVTIAGLARAARRDARCDGRAGLRRRGDAGQSHQLACRHRPSARARIHAERVARTRAPRRRRVVPRGTDRRMSKPLKIGLVMQGGAGWMGGAEYIKNLALALAAIEAREPQGMEVSIITGHPLEESWRAELGRVARIIDLPARRRGLVSRALKLGNRAFASAVRGAALDFVFPLTYDNVGNVGVLLPLGASLAPARWAGWIPDFQHKLLPQLFSAKEIAQRDRGISELGRDAKTLVFSSEAAARDFQALLPGLDGARGTAPLLHRAESRVVRRRSRGGAGEVSSARPLLPHQ